MSAAAAAIKKKRKRRKKVRSLGSNLVRLSDSVLGVLRRSRRGSEPTDETLRRLLGLPTRKGEPQPLKSFYIIENGTQPLCFLDYAHARGVAVQRAVQKELSWNKAEAVLLCRQVPGV